jgi:hypothetical protein
MRAGLMAWLERMEPERRQRVVGFLLGAVLFFPIWMAIGFFAIWLAER